MLKTHVELYNDRLHFALKVAGSVGWISLRVEVEDDFTWIFNFPYEAKSTPYRFQCEMRSIIIPFHMGFQLSA